MDSLVKRSRVAIGKKSKPSYSLIDTQSIKKTYAAKERGIKSRRYFQTQWATRRS